VAVSENYLTDGSRIALDLRQSAESFVLVRSHLA
jgi:hypothetical protein